MCLTNARHPLLNLSGDTCVCTTSNDFLYHGFAIGSVLMQRLCDWSEYISKQKSSQLRTAMILTLFSGIECTPLVLSFDLSPTHPLYRFPPVAATEVLLICGSA